MNARTLLHPAAVSPVAPPLTRDLDADEFASLCGEAAADIQDMDTRVSDIGAAGAREGLSILRREVDALGGTVRPDDAAGAGYNQAIGYVLALLDHLGAKVR